MHHKHRDTLTLGQIMISLWYPAWDQAHRDHVKKKRKNSKHKRGMTAITAVLGLSVPPRSKWVVYKHNFSVTGLQSQGSSFQSKGHKFSAKQSRLVKKKKIPFKHSGRGGRRNERTSWQTVHTSCFYVWPTHHSCEHNLPLDPTGKLKVPFSILNSCRWPPGTLSGFIPPAYSFVFCLVFCFFESSGRQVTWGWTSRRAAHSQNAIKLQKQAFLALWLQCWATCCASLDHWHVWQKGKEAAERETDLFLYLFILFYCFFAKLFWHIYG